MADFETNDIVRCSCRMSFEGSHDIVNVYHLNLDAGGPLDITTMSGALQNYFDSVYGFITSMLSDEVLPVSIGVANVTQDTVFGAIDWGVWAGGTNVNESTAPGVACLGWGRTTKSRVQIRKYYGVFTEQNMTNGLWDSGLTGDVEDAIEYHISQRTPSVGITFTGCAYNYATGTPTFAISEASTREPVYQRRRRRGRGG